MEMEGRSESKGDPQLETLEILKEIADSEIERIVSKTPENKIEVPAVSSEEVFSHGEESRPSSILVANLANRIKKTMVEIRGLTESSGEIQRPAFGQSFIDMIDILKI
jgi:hypothetical protein